MAKAKPKIDPRWAEGSAYNIIQEIAIGFQKSQVLFSVVELDIFSLIGEGKKTAKELAETIGVNSRFLERLLNALVAIKLLYKTEMYYKNTELSAQHLIKTSEDYYGFLLHSSDLWESWGTLTDVIKTGKVKAKERLCDKDEKWIHDFLLSADWRAKIEIDYIMKFLLSNIKSFNKLLCLGLGSGRYAVEFAKESPNTQVYLFDYPKVVNVAEEMIREESSTLEKNINFIEGDLLADDFGEDYNCIFISNLLHDYSVVENINTLKRLYKSLARGGKLIIHQQLIDDHRTSPLVTVLQSINLLVNTESGDSYTYADIWVTVKEAGFGEVEFYKTTFGTCVIIAHKSLVG